MCHLQMNATMKIWSRCSIQQKEHSSKALHRKGSKEGPYSILARQQTESVLDTQYYLALYCYHISNRRQGQLTSHTTYMRVKWYAFYLQLSVLLYFDLLMIKSLWFGLDGLISAMLLIFLSRHIQPLVVLIYPHITLQVAERRRKIFCVRQATCNVI